MINADFAQLQAAILNICVNANKALEHTPEPEIKIHTEMVTTESLLPAGHILDDGVFVRLKISNNGSQIPAEIMDRIFEPFFTTKLPGEGIGLGLSTVFSTINAMGGRLFVDSDETETAFNIYLPVLVDISTDIDDEQKIICGEGRILFVDDDDHVRENIGMCIRDFGYNLDTCSSSVEALKLFKKQGEMYDLVILDMLMPVMNGVELYKKLRIIRPEIKVILLSGHIGNKALDTDVIEGLAMCLNKPIREADLSQVINKVLTKTKEH